MIDEISGVEIAPACALKSKPQKDCLGYLLDNDAVVTTGKSH